MKLGLLLGLIWFPKGSCGSLACFLLF